MYSDFNNLHIQRYYKIRHLLFQMVILFLFSFFQVNSEKKLNLSEKKCLEYDSQETILSFFLLLKCRHSVEKTQIHTFLSLSLKLYFSLHIVATSFFFLFTLFLFVFLSSLSLSPLSLFPLSLSVLLLFLTLSYPSSIHLHTQFFLSIYPSHKHLHIVYVFSFFVSYSLCL